MNAESAYFDTIFPGPLTECRVNSAENICLEISIAQPDMYSKYTERHVNSVEYLRNWNKYSPHGYMQ